MEQKQEQPIYLFVSQSCKHCHKLIQEIQQKPELAKKVQGVPVETVPKLPDGVTKVPSLLVNGKILTGKKCFEWVSKYGEIEASPVYSAASGFESDGFSYLEDSNGGGGSGLYSFIGAEDGSQGIDKREVDNNYKQETNNSKNNTVDMDMLRQQRMKEIGMR